MTNIRNDGRLIRARWVVGAALALVIALCWGWIVPMALDMYGPMTSWSAWMMTGTWDFPHQLLLFAMWAVMMIGMMLPTAAPAVFYYTSAVQTDPKNERVPARVFAFAAGYMVVWTIFSLLATVVQLTLTWTAQLSPMMELRSHWVGAGLVLMVGAYQFTPWKRKCLSCCRTPVADGESFRTGLRNGLSCLGCCWALMLLLFVGGVMNLWWITGLTVFVLLEKMAPCWIQCARVSGVLLLVGGIWILR